MGQSADAKIAWGADLEGLDGERISELTEIIDHPESALEMVWHGYDFEGHFLAIKESVQTASWDGPSHMAPLISDTTAWLRMFEVFCDKQDIHLAKPTWNLMASYA